MQNKSKQSKSDKKIEELSIVELIKANAMLSQNCMNLSQHISKCEMDINSLYHQNLFLKRELNDVRSVIEVFAMKMGIDKEIFDKQQDSAPRKRGEKAEKVEREAKTLPLHDDLTIRCPSCKSVNHKESKSCSECGYKNK